MIMSIRRRFIAAGAVFAVGITTVLGMFHAPQALAAPGANEIAVTFTVSGARGTDDTINPAMGAHLQLVGDGVAYTEPWAYCTVDANGCQFLIPLSSAANHKFSVAVAPDSANAWSIIPTDIPARVTISESPLGGTSYHAPIAVVLSVANPQMVSNCGETGLKMAFVVDLSGSMDGAGITSLKAAASAYVDALTGTDSSVALYTFSGNSPASGANSDARPLTSVQTQQGADQVKSWISLWTPDGGTNWDSGLRAAANSADTYDYVIFITDGEPNLVIQDGSPTPATTNDLLTVNDTASANALKAKGTRIIALGVALQFGADEQRFVEISGPVHGNSNPMMNDYFLTNWQAFSDVLLPMVHGSCQIVNVVYVDDDNDGAIVTPAEGTTTTLTGNPGEDVGFTEQMARDGVPDGYQFSSIDNVATFSSDPDVSQTITVHLTRVPDSPEVPVTDTGDQIVDTGGTTLPANMAWAWLAIIGCVLAGAAGLRLRNATR